MQNIRVLIADDHDLVRESVRAILVNEKDFEVVATAQNGREAVELSAELHPDVVVMDISMPVLDGIRSTAQIRSSDPNIHVVILSMHVNAALVQQAFRLGASGYVLKQRVSDELPQAVRVAHEGDVFLSESIPSSFRPTA